MARIWSEYTAPDGRSYYYNFVTKESTWQRPKSFDEVDESQDAKKLKKVETRPHVVLELVNGWHLVLSDIGKKFYYNVETGQSVWALPDEESSTMLNSLDRNKLVALVGLTRGYPLGGLSVYDELVSDLQKMRQEREMNKSKELENGEEEDPDSSEEAHGLVEGYSSSENDEDDQGQNQEREEGPKIELAEYLEEPINTSEDRRALWNLFSQYDLNPYSAWPFEMKKIRQDPDFYRVSDDAICEDIFEEWCASIISADRDGTENPEHLSNEQEGEDYELEPIKYHYLAHIVSKSTINPTTIFMDIKEENKLLFKKYKIKHFVNSKKDQESFASKLLFYYKSMDLEKRKQDFRTLLQQHERSIKENLKNDMDNVRHLLDQKINTDDAYAVETQLFKMELAIGLWGSLAVLVEQPRYYTLGIRDKMLELHGYLNALL